MEIWKLKCGIWLQKAHETFSWMRYHPKYQKSGCKCFEVKDITLPFAASALTWCHSLTPNGAFTRPNNQIIYN